MKQTAGTVILSICLIFVCGNPIDQKQEQEVSEVPSTTTTVEIVTELTEIPDTESSQGGITVTDSSTRETTEIPGVTVEPEPINEGQSPCNSSTNGIYYDQRAVLYEGKDQQGEQFVIPLTNVQDLRELNFDNRASSVCLTGIWLFYVENNYNTEPNAGMEYVFGPNNFCTNLRYVPGYLRSARFVGSPADYRSDTVTIFRDLYFQGDMEYIFSDLTDLTLENSHKSLIITGTSAWTFYTETEYEGDSVCLHPPSSKDTAPFFVCDLSTVKIPYGSIKSARKGCWDKSNCDPNNHNNTQIVGNPVPV